jgi:hypothetical protein
MHPRRLPLNSIVRQFVKIRDITWKMTFVLVGLIATSHIVCNVAIFNGDVSGGIISFGICFGIMIVILYLSTYSVRGGPPFMPIHTPHPKYPSGRQPRVKIQFIAGLMLISVFVLILLLTKQTA